MRLPLIRTLALLWFSAGLSFGQFILTTFPNPALPGQQVTLTASPAPSGTPVTFYNGADQSGPVITSAMSSGDPVSAPATLKDGISQIVACYPTGNLPSCPQVCSNIITQIVGVIPATKLTVTSSPNPSVVGQAVTLTATITPLFAPGVITFFDGGTEMGETAVSNGSASLTTSGLASGSHRLTFFYGGGGLYTPFSTTIVQTVNPGNPVTPVTPVTKATTSTTTLSANPLAANAGQPVTLTASVSPSSATGTITFLDGATAMGSAGVSAGTAVLTIPTLSAGPHTLTASYAGNANFASSVSPPVTVSMGVCQSGGSPNLAMCKSAAQSSTLPGYAFTGAGAAIDGNTDGTFSNGSASSTNLDNSAWWQVDLGTSMAIGSIAIWNRTDACSSRLNDYWVFVSDTPFLATDTPFTLQFRPGTWSSHYTTAPNPSTAITAATQGRYVRVQLTFPNYLTLAEVQVFAPSAQSNGNLAQGRPATQSSTLPGFATAVAGSAVDGNTNGNFSGGSVTATNLDSNAWWQVDLGASTAMGSIVIWNRADCCGSRLNDYWVFVSDTPFSPTDTPATLQFRAGTWASHQTSTPNPSSTIAAPTRGRYVRVQLSFPNYLTLAEVQVFAPAAQPTNANLAQGKPAAQSSTLPGFATASAGSAADGNTDGNFSGGSVTATNLDSNAWWQVDLGASTAIGSIVIWNRADCCGSRLNDYWVFVSDSPFSPTDTPASLQFRAGTWASHQTSAPNPSSTIAAPTQGRYVRVQLSFANYLSLAEVQVFAPPSNLAVGKTATQSSTLGGYATAGAGSAVDGNTDGSFSGGSVTATNLDSNAWWQVDLGTSSTIASIAIWNRTDCCGSRLNDYWVFVSDTPFSPTDTPGTLQFRAATWSSHQTTVPNPSTSIPVGAQGRYVRVQLTGASNLSLGEVQVWGH